MPDHAQLLAEIERRERVAREASPAPWNDDDRVTAWIVDADRKPVAKGAWGHADADHIALHDPADAQRRYTHYRRILERHAPDNELHAEHEITRCCVGCSWADSIEVMAWPCEEIRDLADALGLGDDHDH